MNKILATIIIGTLMVPSASYAQTVEAPLTLESLYAKVAELQQLLSLIQMVERLQEQLAELRAGQDEVRTETRRIADRIDRDEREEDEEEDRDNGESVGGSEPEEDVEVDFHKITVSDTVLSVYTSVTSNESDIEIDEDFSFDLSPNASVDTQFNCPGGCQGNSRIEEGRRANIYFNIDISDLEPGEYTFEMRGFNYETPSGDSEFVEVDAEKTFTVN